MSRPTAPLAEREHVVYRFYDAAGGLLYVGMTSDLPARLRQHAADKPWWGQVAEIKSKSYPDQETAAAAELLAVISERPVHNKAMNYGDLQEAILASRRGKLRRMASAMGIGWWVVAIWITLCVLIGASGFLIGGDAPAVTTSIGVMLFFVGGMGTIDEWGNIKSWIEGVVRA